MPPPLGHFARLHLCPRARVSGGDGRMLIVGSSGGRVCSAARFEPKYELRAPIKSCGQRDGGGSERVSLTQLVVHNRDSTTAAAAAAVAVVVDSPSAWRLVTLVSARWSPLEARARDDIWPSNARLSSLSFGGSTSYGFGLKSFVCSHERAPRQRAARFAVKRAAHRSASLNSQHRASFARSRHERRSPSRLIRRAALRAPDSSPVKSDELRLAQSAGYARAQRSSARVDTRDRRRCRRRRRRHCRARVKLFAGRRLADARAATTTQPILSVVFCAAA